MAETPSGDIAGGAAAQVAALAADADAVLIGPGLTDDDALAALVAAVLGQVEQQPVVIDACRLRAVTPAAVGERAATVVLTPNSSEAAGLLGSDPDEVAAEPLAAHRELVARFGCTVTLRGGETFSGGPGGPVYREQGGTPGLGSSGSGDVLTGFLTGLLARGAPPVDAAVWACHVHALSGQRLGSRIGRLGYLARELLDELTPVMDQLCG